ncbi:MAG: alginate export family protein [Cellvibrionaceae bacterium]
MKNLTKSALSVAIALTTLSLPSLGNEETISEALKEGDVTLSFRLRGEQVDVDGADKVDLTSLKTRLTYKSAGYKGFSGLIEMDDVTHVSDFEGGVADPEGTEVNQAYIAYAFGGALEGTTVKYGRQRILLDNQRFVGGVGFRQNEQTYDGLTIVNKSLPDTTLFFAHIDNVNRIFGEDSPIGDHENDTYLFNAKYAGLEAGTLTGYAYLIDNEDAAAYSTDTYGLRFAGKTGSFGYALEYATQSDAANNPSNYDADYVLAEGSFKVGDVTLKGGYELLGADGADGQFITPLATLHKFQGWNDKFLGGGTGNIAGGIEDVYFSASTKLAGVKLSVVYHQLESDDSKVSGMDDLGSEIGFVVAKKLGPVGLSLKYSDYSADDFGADTDKLWLTASAKF